MIIWTCRICGVVGAIPKDRMPWADVWNAEHSGVAPNCEGDIVYKELDTQPDGKTEILVPPKEKEQFCEKGPDPSGMLAPCPFCGLLKGDLLEDYDGEDGIYAWTVCHGCQAQGPFFEGEHSYYRAAIGWNSRSLKPEQLSITVRLAKKIEGDFRPVRKEFEPLPCPFCSSDNIAFSEDSKVLKCMNCEAEGANRQDDDATEEELVGYWDARGTGKSLERRVYDDTDD